MASPTPDQNSVPPAVEIDSLYLSPESLGAEPIDSSILADFEHIYLRRGIFNAQVGMKDLHGQQFYVYIPISPTNRLSHLRHYLFFRLAKDLQATKGCYVVIHMTDVKAIERDVKSKWADVDKWKVDTAKDILAFGFDMTKTLILYNTVAPELDYVMLCDLQRKVPLGDFFNNLFKDDSVNVGLIDTIFQSAAISLPSYLSRVFGKNSPLKCLILCRPSQKAFADFCRKLSEVSGDSPAAILYGGFVPALQSREKMPKCAKIAQVGNKVDYQTIYLKNTAKEVSQKLNKFAFSGGRDRKEDQQETGANLAVDVPFYYIKLFEENDAEFEKIKMYYGPGPLPEGNEKRLLTGEVKKICGEIIAKHLKTFQDNRAKVQDSAVQEVTKLRILV